MNIVPVAIPLSQPRYGLIGIGISFFSAAIALFAVAAVYFSDPLLTIKSPYQKVDVMVVLGGDGPARAAHAAMLWHDDLADKILISGDGDCFSIRRLLIEAGVDPIKIWVECDSGTTWQNAAYSAPILQKLGAQRAALVTNWFHSRRAIGSFAKSCPGIEWSSWPVAPPDTFSTIFWGPYGPAVLKEYPKLLWYMLRGHQGFSMPEPDKTGPNTTVLCPAEGATS
ncbi:YdcF family protein [Paraburkholderia aspalathi]|nr:YdcF family protein [Paraburkholderia aspalathi]